VFVARMVGCIAHKQAPLLLLPVEHHVPALTQLSVAQSQRVCAYSMCMCRCIMCMYLKHLQFCLEVYPPTPHLHTRTRTPVCIVVVSQWAAMGTMLLGLPHLPDQGAMTYTCVHIPVQDYGGGAVREAHWHDAAAAGPRAGRVQGASQREWSVCAAAARCVPQIKPST
jgi:hypothetical protein